MKIDLRFVEFERELQIHGDYIEMLETHLPAIVEAERKRLYDAYADSAPEERGGLDFLEDDLNQGIVTRSFVLASLVGIWATYESSVTAVADVGRKSAGVHLRVDDLRGNLLERALRYFDEVLKFQLHTVEADVRVLRDLAVVRNIFAHTSGFVRKLSDRRMTELKQVVARNPGIQVVNDVLVAKPNAAKRFHDSVESLLLDLFRRARKAF